MRTKLVAAAVSALLALPAAAAGCYSHVWASDIVRERTAKDIKCPPDDLVIEDLGENRYRASGCGRKRVWVCTNQYVSDIASHTLGCKEDVLGE
jgi:hypothetical protein